MELTFPCPRCETLNRSGDVAVDRSLRCDSCGWTRTLENMPEGDAAPQECLRCGNADLWRQKDFPQWLGFLFVAAGAVTSSIAWAYHRPILALSILMAFALVDMILYLIMPDVLVCYRCRTRHHHTDVSGHETFNHELAERYRQERLRLQQADVSSRPLPSDDPSTSLT